MKRIFLIGAALLICSAAAMAQYTNELEDGTEQTVSNVWSTTTVWVGNTTPSNTLYVTAGGDIDSADVFVGGSSNAFDNVISMTGTSRWDIAGQLVIGEGPDNSVSVANGSTLSATGLTLYSGNELTVEDGGSIEGLISMSVYSNSTIRGDGIIGFDANPATLAFFGTNITLDAGVVFSANAGFVNTLSFNDGELDVLEFDPGQYENFGNLELVDSDLTGAGSLTNFNRIDMTGGVIDPKGENSDTAQLTIGGAFTATGGTVYQADVYETRHDELVFTGSDPVNLSNMEADVLVVSAPLGPVTILSSTTNLVGTFASTKVDDRLLLYKAVLQVTNNVVQIKLKADPLESSMEFASTEMIRAGFSGMKNAVFARTKQLRRNLVATVHAVPNEAFLLTNTNAPAGAMGPGDQDTIFDMHLWVQQYNGQGDFDHQGLSDGFTLNNQGTTIGADRLIGEALTLGLNYTYARSSARTTGSDDLDSETYWLGAYGEWVGEEGLYVDAMVAYGNSDYDTERQEESYRGTASYRGQAIGAYADVGQYYYRGNLALSPYVGIHVLAIQVDNHKETDERGSSVDVDEVTRDIVESAIGLKMRHRFDTRIGRFQITGFAEWAHDFIEDDVSADMTAQGFPSVSTGSISPDADTFNVGLGYSWVTTEYMEIGIGYTGRFSDDYEEHGGSLMLDIMF